jgi:outer membrane protein assembly factor BamB
MRRRVVRISAIVVAAMLILAGSAVVIYRVLSPHEQLTQPTVPYPEAVVVTAERPFSELRAAPLVIEGRLRVYA